MQKNRIDLNRRQFLRVGLLAGASLVVSIQLPCGRGEAASSAPPANVKDLFSPNAWIKIHSDDSVSVVVNHSEMGQGIATALPMIVAEELSADWRKVKFEMAPAADVYKHPAFGIQWTVSSKSVQSSWDLLRQAGAAARGLLISTAARIWSVPGDECRAADGRVLQERSARTLRFGELIVEAAKLPLPRTVRLKKPNEFNIIGRTLHRLDSQAKINGSAKFGLDIRLPGMLTALMIHPPVFGAKVKSIDSDGILAMPGIRRVVPTETGVAIVAETFWQARVAEGKASVEWQKHKREQVDSESLFERWARLGHQKGKIFFESGNVEEIIPTTKTVLEAAYDLPYQAHATPEPMNCTADVRKASCMIWAPTQNQGAAREIAARITGLADKAITIHTTYLGGGFGRRALVDYVGEAVELSKEMKAPVKVIWTREEDMGRDYYRPATHNRMLAVLDKTGRPLAWRHRIVGADAFSQALPEVVTAMMPDISRGLSRMRQLPWPDATCRRASPGKKP